MQENVENEFIDGVNEFGLRIFLREIEKSKSENSFISPYCLWSSLVVCYFGAREDVKRELADLLHLSENEINIHEKLINLIRNYRTQLKNQTNEKVEFNQAGKIYLAADFSIRDEFKALVDDKLASEIETIDMNSADFASKHINSWVSDQTNEKIKNFISAGDLGKLTKMIVVSTVYFKSDWTFKFDSAQTYKDLFNMYDGTQRQVDMMKLLNKRLQLFVNPCEIQKTSICHLPFKGKNFQMMIILPDNQQSMVDLIKKLDHNLVRKLLSIEGKKSKKVFLFLPKFMINFRDEMSESLKSQGCKSMFDEKLADFGEISDHANGLYVTNIIHQSYVEINEKGCEAAAASGIISGRKRKCVEKIYEFKCNKPFIFVIYEKQAKSILFIGQFIAPQ